MNNAGDIAESSSSSVPAAGVSVSNEHEIRKESNMDYLARDYGLISQLMIKLDQEMKPFVSSIGQVVNSVPAHDSLAATLDSYGESMSTLDQGKSDPNNLTGANDVAGSKENDEKEKDGQEDQYDPVLGDEAAEKDDPLVFL
mmetsp:Transcript_26147/g.47454  ORF Transcript_26147/g.47454 Transcript_26147/m.47454 type:complete len:142 (-) Transcript_26147:975-1400(-)